MTMTVAVTVVRLRVWTRMGARVAWEMWKWVRVREWEWVLRKGSGSR
jgi:hypothetical protein